MFTASFTLHLENTKTIIFEFYSHVKPENRRFIKLSAQKPAPWISDQNNTKSSTNDIVVGPS